MKRQFFFRFFLVLALVGMVSAVCADGPGLMKREKKAEVADKVADKEAAPALGEKDEREEELFKDFPRPEKRPKVREEHLDSAKKRYADLVALYDDLGDLIRERHFLMQETDDKHARKRKRELEKLDREIFKQKKELVKEAKKLRRPLDRRLEGYLKEKEANDKKVESAEKSGNEKRAQKLAQEFAKKGARIENTQMSIDGINYFLFWDEFLK
jgi:hypothetical protein